MGSDKKKDYNVDAVNAMFDETLKYFKQFTAKGLPEGYYEESVKVYGGTEDAI